MDERDDIQSLMTSIILNMIVTLACLLCVNMTTGV